MARDGGRRSTFNPVSMRNGISLDEALEVNAEDYRNLSLVCAGDIVMISFLHDIQFIATSKKIIEIQSKVLRLPSTTSCRYTKTPCNTKKSQYVCQDNQSVQALSSPQNIIQSQHAYENLVTFQFTVSSTQVTFKHQQTIRVSNNVVEFQGVV